MPGSMGSFYWPGLRDGDWYSMTTKSGSGSGTTLSIPNQSGLDRLHASWCGATGTGGSGGVATGGATSTGGASAAGGNSSTGGSAAAGGSAAGGAKATGGSVAATGGTAASNGGAKATGGSVATTGGNTASTGGKQSNGRHYRRAEHRRPSVNGWRQQPDRRRSFHHWWRAEHGGRKWFWRPVGNGWCRCSRRGTTLRWFCRHNRSGNHNH